MARLSPTFPDLRVFISFAEVDREIADRFAQTLQSFGIEPYLLGEQSSIHTDLAIESRNAIEASYAFLLLVSSSSDRSEAVKEELEFAHTRCDNVIAMVSVDGTLPSAGLARRLWTEATANLDQRRTLKFENGLEHPDHVAKALYELRPLKWTQQSEPIVHFSLELTPEQVKGVLEALSNYWRACGGIGLSVDFQIEEAEISETVYA